MCGQCHLVVLHDIYNILCTENLNIATFAGQLHTAFSCRHFSVKECANLTSLTKHLTVIWLKACVQTSVCRICGITACTAIGSTAEQHRLQYCCVFLAIAPMVQCAKGLAQNPRDPSAVSQWRGANHQVLFQLVYSAVSVSWVCISIFELI